MRRSKPAFLKSGAFYLTGGAPGVHVVPEIPLDLYSAWGLRRLVPGYAGPVAQVRTQTSSGVYADVDVATGPDGYLNLDDLAALPTLEGHMWLQALYDQTGAGRHVLFPAGSGARLRTNGLWLTAPRGRTLAPIFLRSNDRGIAADYEWPGGDATISAVVHTEKYGSEWAVFLATVGFSDDAGWTHGVNMAATGLSEIEAGAARFSFSGRRAGNAGSGAYEGFGAIDRGTLSIDVQTGAAVPFETRVNGRVLEGGENLTSGVTAAQTADLVFGNIHGGTISIGGKIPEIVIYNRALSASEKEALWHNRRHHLFGTRIVALDGGSHMEGHAFLDTTPEQYMKPHLPDWGVLNFAQSGQTLAMMEATSAYTVDLVPADGYQKSVIIYGQWYNTMVGGVTPAQMVAAIQQWSANRRAAGFDKVIFANLLTVGAERWGGQYTAENIAIVNSALATALANGEPWIDGIADWASRPELSDPTDTTYFLSDQLHLSPAGIAVQGEVFVAAVAALA